jgi:hypothetical protein
LSQEFELSRLAEITQLVYNKPSPAEEIENPATHMGKKNSEDGQNFPARRKLVCRFLAILFAHSFLFEGQALEHICVKYANYLFDIVKRDPMNLLDLLGSIPKGQFSQVLESLNNTIALKILESGESTKVGHEVVICIRVMEYFFRANKVYKLVSKMDFVNDALSDSLNMRKLAGEYYALKLNLGRKSDFSILEYPYLFTTAAKVDVIQAENECIQQSTMINSMMGGGGLGFMNMNNMHLNITVRRDYILQDALGKLMNQGKNLRKPLKVSFSGEAGVDAGGVRKEFFTLLIKELFNPNYAMFTTKNVGSKFEDSGTIPVVQPHKFRS